MSLVCSIVSHSMWGVHAMAAVSLTQFMREFSAVWKWTIDEKKGIFSAQSDSAHKGTHRPPPLSVRQHTLLIQVCSIAGVTVGVVYSELFSCSFWRIV